MWIIHSGISKLDGAPGRGSGRYPLGSGKRPFRHQVEGTTAKKKKETVADAKDNLNAKQKKTLFKRLSGDKKDPSGRDNQPKKNVSEMSDDELIRLKNRNELVKNYLESETNLINAKTSYAAATSKKTGMKRAKAEVEKMLANSASTVGQQLVTYALGSAVNKALGQNVIKTQGGNPGDKNKK